MDLWQPFIIGIFGSFHCMGMCGPIAVSLPLNQYSRRTKFISSGVYNFGRVTSYIVLGLIFGILGFGIHIWGWQQWVSIGAGTVMILSVGFPVIFHGSKLIGWLDRIFAGFKRYFGKFFGFRTYFSTWVIGVLNGFLPCGLVYIALAGALLTPTPLDGALYMLMFGVGTIPALMSLSLLGNVISLAFRRRVQKIIPFIIIGIGILFVLRGMNLGIPYLSPKMDQHQNHKTEQLQKPECCH
jgi:sulfite exporter TauE/SafE